MERKIEDNKPVSIEVQAALTVIGRRNSEQDNIKNTTEVKRLNLSKSNLSSADLDSADLDSADLDGSILLNANLTDTNLTNAYLADANLAKVNFFRTNLTKAELENANLTGADLSTVNNLTNANFTDANLTGANLKSKIDSTITNDSNRYERLDFKVIKSACFWEKAVYTEPDLIWYATNKKWVADARNWHYRSQ